eukprot:m.27827 g.27827  ORF g.27827 m.27827 type:complete len:271 (+) comp8979_c0_seq1:476-1288(+)
MEYLNKALAVIQQYDSPESIAYYASVLTVFGVTASALLLAGIQAPYGRYNGANGKIFGFDLPGRVAWVLQEAPCLTMVALYGLWLGSPEATGSIANLALVSMYAIHYIHRTLIFPFVIKPKPSRVGVVAMAFAFCTTNGLMQAASLLKNEVYDPSWVFDIRFIVGVCMFYIGMAINIHSDYTLSNLRKPGETGYKIPRGGMFEYVSGANFFGEIVEWTGFAIATWNIAGATFAFFTLCNIGPRAIQHHKWYHTKFEDYPKSRKALIPFVI